MKVFEITYERFREKYREEIETINSIIQEIRDDKLTDASRKLDIRLSFDKSLDEIQNGSGSMDAKKYNYLKQEVELWVRFVKRLQKEKDDMLEFIKEANKKYEERQRKYESCGDIWEGVVREDEPVYESKKESK